MKNFSVLPSLSILSVCNNHCPYCFQGNNNKQKDEILSFEDVKNIIAWIKKEYDGIVILGGEPLLHNDILTIMNYISKELYRCKLITNLVTADSNKIVNLSNLTNMSWLINTTTDKSNKEVFDYNLDILLKTINYSKNDSRIISFSTTLTGSPDLDVLYLDNLFKILKKLPKVHRRVRLTPNMPHGDKLYNIYNYDFQFNYLLDKLEKDSIRIALSFDCGVNYCFISQKTLNRLKELTCFLSHLKTCPGPFIDIGVDKKIYYCHYASNEYFIPEYYYNFENPSDYIKSFEIKKYNFLSQYQYICKNLFNNPFHCENNCVGFCPALSAKILNKQIVL